MSLLKAFSYKCVDPTKDARLAVHDSDSQHTGTPWALLPSRPPTFPDADGELLLRCNVKYVEERGERVWKKKGNQILMIRNQRGRGRGAEGAEEQEEGGQKERKVIGHAQGAYCGMAIPHFN